MLEAVTEEQEKAFKAAINIKLYSGAEIEVRNDPFRKIASGTMMVW